MTNRADVPIAGSILDVHGDRCENGCNSSVVFILAGRHICAECYLRYTAPIAPAATESQEEADADANIGCEHTWDDVAVATACVLCGAVRLEADLARVTAERDEALSQRARAEDRRYEAAVHMRDVTIVRLREELDEARRMEGLAARAVEAVRGQLSIAWDERDEARRGLAVAVTACEGWQADLAAATRVVEVARRVVRAQNAMAAAVKRGDGSAAMGESGDADRALDAAIAAFDARTKS